MKEIEEILEKAVTAPSGDNSQPWWFHVEGDTVDVHLYPARDNRILNFELSGSHIAMGALIENICIAATAHEQVARVTLFPDASVQHLIARIQFEKSEVTQDPLYDVLSLRCTNRKPYQKRELEEGVLEQLLLSNTSDARAEIKLVTDKREMKTLADASSVMERVALETEPIHKLFFESIVWTPQEEMERGMGLPIKATELPPPIQLLFRAIRHWKIANILNYVGLSLMASKANAATYATGSATGIILAERFDKFAYVEAGRVFERAWLISTLHGLAFQPVTGVLFLGRRLVAKQTEVFNAKHLPMIQKAYATITPIFDTKEKVPAMLFRIGYADSPSARTIRKPPEIR